MDSVEPQEGIKQVEGSDRMLDASPPAAPAPDADEVRRECDMEMAEASAAVEDPPAAAPAANEAKMGEAGEGITAEHEHIVAPLVSEAKVEADEGSTAGEEHAAAPVASGVKMEVSEGSILDKEQDAAVPVAGEAKMEVDESSIPEQEHTVAAVASEVRMEEGAGRLVDQQPTTPAGISQVKEDDGECLVGRYISRSAAGHGRIHLGKVASYDSSTGMYSVVFEGGQGEDLGLPQLREILMADENGASGMKVSCRKRKLDLLVSSGSAMEVKGPPSTRQRVDACEMSARPDASQQSGSGSDISEDAESSSNSSDSTKELPAETCPLLEIYV